MSQTVAMKTLYGAVASLHNAAHLLAIQDNQAQALVRSYNLLDAETAKTKRKLAKAERELTKYRKKAARAAYKRKMWKSQLVRHTTMSLYRELRYYGSSIAGALSTINKLKELNAGP